MIPSKITWYGLLKDGSTIKMNDGIFYDEEELTTSRQAALDFLEESDYTVVALLADIQPIASC